LSLFEKKPLEILRGFHYKRALLALDLRGIRVRGASLDESHFLHHFHYYYLCFLIPIDGSIFLLQGSQLDLSLSQLMTKRQT
jgi:hypothetical protein